MPESACVRDIQQPVLLPRIAPNSTRVSMPSVPVQLLIGRGETMLDMADESVRTSV